ncbi:Beta-lactamase repressor BlaI [Planctomycetales bacterium 10988]|nr:Beta-lactamase repressor BlaI [Planctomycetales bacterium 10988]
MQISDAEWQVMNLVWESSPVESNEVIEELAQLNNWSPATVKTMLHRLVKKGALKTESVGKKYLYRASVRRYDCVRRESRSFLERVFDGQAAPALMHFVKYAKLTPEEIAEIQELLDTKAAKKKDQWND